jgi:hypothetical protein
MPFQTELGHCDVGVSIRSSGPQVFGFTRSGERGGWVTLQLRGGEGRCWGHRKVKRQAERERKAKKERKFEKKARKEK